MPMLGLGAVLLVEGETGSYGLAGAVSGTLALARLAGQPAVGPRHGPPRARASSCAWAMTGFLVTGVAFVVRRRRRRARGGAGSCSPALTGASGPNIGSLVRARWAARPRHRPAGRRRSRFESVVDEVVFVVGPPLVTLLATLIARRSGFLTGVVIGVVGGLWLARLRTTEPPVQPRRRRRARAPARRC